jgi:hypothetical protein
MMPPQVHESPLERDEILSRHLESLKHTFARVEEHGIHWILGFVRTLLDGFVPSSDLYVYRREPLMGAKFIQDDLFFFRGPRSGSMCLRHVIGRCGSRSITFKCGFGPALYTATCRRRDHQFAYAPHDQPCSGLPTVVRPSFRIFLSQVRHGYKDPTVLATHGFFLTVPSLPQLSPVPYHQ